MSRGSEHSYNSSLVNTVNTIGSVPDTIIKHLQSRTLMEHYEDKKYKKMHEEQLARIQKMRQMEQARLQSEFYQRDLQRKRRHKQIMKIQYSKQYDEMIRQKQEKQQYQKEKQLFLEKKMNNNESWMRSSFQQKEEIRLKKLEYGKQLQRHMDEQEQKKKQEAQWQKQFKEKLKREAEEIARRDKEQLQLKHKRKSMFEKRQNQILGISEPQTNSSSFDRRESYELYQSLTPRIMKKYEQKVYGDGLSVQYRSQSQKKYADKRFDYQYINPQKQQTAASEIYNPITNPIQFKYKNPNVLRMLAGYS